LKVSSVRISSAMRKPVWPSTAVMQSFRDISRYDLTFRSDERACVELELFEIGQGLSRNGEVALASSGDHSCGTPLVGSKSCHANVQTTLSTIWTLFYRDPSGLGNCDSQRLLW
jgi:hypothetical protein